LTPVSVDAKIGGEHDTALDEDNMVKIQTGDSSQVEYITDSVEQTYNEIQEYPLWLILAFALALPSPLGVYSKWREQRRLTKQIVLLTKALAASQPTSTMKPEAKVS
jgi:hypothetical protein